MMSFTKFLALGAVLTASSSLAFADTLNGTFTISGNTTYTSSSVQFGTAQIGAATDTGTQQITGTFASYLTDQNSVDFFQGPLNINTNNGTNTVLPPFELFQTTENGETFQFFISGYNATYDSDSLGSDLTIRGTGFFDGIDVATGVMNYGDTAGSFRFSAQTINGQTTATTFSASTGATAVTPEPNSLLLLGTGLIGGAGLLFLRRRNADMLA